MELIRHAWENCIPLGAAHRQLMRDFRLYMLVGGMPQAVAAYMETNNFRKVDDAKRGILTLYEEDFRKIDVSGRASQIFSNIPSQLSSNASRYKVASVLPGAKRDRLAEIFSDLQDSHTVLAAYHANDPNVGMALTRDIEYYKIFLLDTGLFTTLVYRDKDNTENDLYVRLLNDKQHTNMGYLYENVVAQMLAAKGDSLFYYTFQTDNNSSRYEIDFLIARQGKLCPLEVKSSGYKTHKSLDAFQEKFSSRISHRYLVYTKDFQKQGDVICLPTYMVPFL